MRVTLTVEALSPQLTGIGRYTHELARRLGSRPDIDEVRFYRNGDWISDPDALLRELPDTGHRAPLSHRLIPRRLRRRMQRRFLSRSVVHGPNYFLPPSVDGGIITIHDLSVFRFPETHPAERLQQFERLFEDSLARAAGILADTEWIRAELLDTFGLAPDKVRTVHLGFDSARYRPPAAAEQHATLAELGLTAGGYALMLATMEPRKKAREAITAWSRLPAALRDRFPLVLAGAAGWLDDRLHQEIERAQAAGWLRFLGYVPETALPALYGGSALFLYPSIYEGFGLPPLEAMACGAPVLVSAGTCLEEVCAEAAHYTRPDDPDRLLEDVRALLEDRAAREAASRRGLERAAGFSWDRCADETAAAYHLFQAVR